MAVCEKCGRAHAGRCRFDIGYIDTHASVDLVGRQVGSYDIVEEIARGGMGLIYKARHRMIGALAAVKVLRPELLTDQLVVDRFVDEARAQARVRHPNTVQVYDLTKAPDGRPCIVMELVEGETLEERLARGALTPAQALPILVQICNGVAAAHAVGIIHRDIKAENVLLMHRYGRTDFVKVLDFSIAKDDRAVRNEAALTSPGTVLGTPYYMAPEQALGKNVDGRVDVYAIGVLAFRCLTCSFPFDGETAQEVMIKQVRDAPPDLEWLPVGLRATLRKALAKSPDERYATVAELAQALRACAAEIAASGTTPPGRGLLAPTLTPKPPPQEPAMRAEVSAGQVRVTYRSPDAFAKAHADELGQGRLYVPYANHVSEKMVALVIAVPGRDEIRCDALVSMNVTAEQGKSWGMEPGFALALRSAIPAPAPAPVAPPEDVVIELTEEIIEEPAAAAAPPDAPATSPATSPAKPAPVAATPAPAPAPAAPPPVFTQAELEADYEAAPGVPASAEEVRQLVMIYEFRSEDGDKYGFLGLPPESDAAEIVAACKRIGSELLRLRTAADAEHAKRIAALLAHLASVRKGLCEPEARATYDAGRGNFQGVARALTAGLARETLEKLHASFVVASRERADKAAGMLPAIDRALNARERLKALELLHQALALDPLSPDLQARYVNLRRLNAPRADAERSAS